MQTRPVVEVLSKDEKKEHDIVNPTLGCITMLQENSNIQISANWWLMEKYCQLPEFENPRWLPSWVITFTRFSENLTSDLEVGVTEIICRCTCGINQLSRSQSWVIPPPAPSLSGWGVKMRSVPTWQANLRRFIWKLLARPKDPVFIASKDPPEKLMWWRELISLLEGKSCRSAAPQNINILLEHCSTREKGLLCHRRNMQIQSVLFCMCKRINE